jgi:hypothetical protein
MRISLLTHLSSLFLTLKPKRLPSIFVAGAAAAAVGSVTEIEANVLPPHSAHEIRLRKASIKSKVTSLHSVSPIDKAKPHSSHSSAPTNKVKTPSSHPHAPISKVKTPSSHSFAPISKVKTPSSHSVAPISKVKTPSSHSVAPIQTPLPKIRSPQAWYVSPSGNNTTGTSLATAWNELDQVQWSNFGLYDFLVIDDGTPSNVPSVTYHTTLTVPASVPYIFIRTSTPWQNAVYPAPHQVILDGTNNPSGVGIDVKAQFVNFQFPRQSVVVQNFTKAGVFFEPSGPDLPPINAAEGLDIHNNTVGLNVLLGSASGGISAVIHDNQTQVIGHPTLVNCWIYNSAYPAQGTSAPGVSGTYANVSNSVIGPGLTEGISTTSGYSVKNTLLINATNANLVSSGGYSYIDNCTSFMTPLNPYGQTHSSIQGPVPYQANNSIFFGGAVTIPLQPAGSYSGNIYNDTEYGVTGNTTLFASSQVDPQFVTNVYAYPNNVPISTLIGTDFSVSAKSPAAGTGSGAPDPEWGPTNSVAQLLTRLLCITPSP